MKYALILLFAGVAFAQFQANKQRDDAAVTIVKQTQEDNGDGTFNWSFQNSDGTEAAQKGYVKNAGSENEIQVMEGFYTYYDTDNKLVKIRYIADENGFQILEDNRL